MNPPTTAAEWAEFCYRQWHNRPHSPYGNMPSLLCLKCTDAYARQQVEAFREQAIEWCPRYCTCPPGTEMDHKRYCAYGIAAAIAALKGEGRGPNP